MLYIQLNARKNGNPCFFALSARPFDAPHGIVIRKRNKPHAYVQSTAYERFGRIRSVRHVRMQMEIKRVTCGTLYTIGMIHHVVRFLH